MHNVNVETLFERCIHHRPSDDIQMVERFLFQNIQCIFIVPFLLSLCLCCITVISSAVLFAPLHGLHWIASDLFDVLEVCIF